MRVVCIIPARVGSTRLPHKPLQLLGGEPLISVVARRVVTLGFADEVIVASDDHRVLNAVSGAEAVRKIMTSEAPQNGTERVAEVASRPDVTAGVIVNVQGDEPFLPEAAVTGLLERLRGGDRLATVASPLGAEDWAAPSVVKVRVRGGNAETFVRETPAAASAWSPDRDEGWAQHLGIYGYTPDALARWTEAPPVPVEVSQRLEQLRPLAYGERMGVAMIREPAPPGIDTPEDLRRAEHYLEISMESVGA